MYPIQKYKNTLNTVITLTKNLYIIHGKTKRNYQFYRSSISNKSKKNKHFTLGQRSFSFIGTKHFCQ